MQDFFFWMVSTEGILFDACSSDVPNMILAARFSKLSSRFF